MSKHRKFVQAGAAIVLLLASVGLGGCGANPDGDETATDQATAPAAEAPAEEPADTAPPAADVNYGSIEDLTWEDGGDAGPAIGYQWPFYLAENAARVVNPGDGPTLEQGQRVIIDFIGLAGENGSVQESTFESGETESFSLTEGIDPVLLNALVGQKVGVEVLYAVPGTAAEDDPEGTVIPANVMALTVRDVVTPLARAEGEPVKLPDGAPTVTLDDDGVPSISVPDSAPPADLVAVDTIKGEGAEVAQGQTVTVHYSGWLWDGEATQFDSSWERGEAFTTALADGQIIPGWVQGLADHTVGSQVLLVIPPDLGYGDEGAGDTIPGGSTLIFVVDILDAF